MTTLNVSPVARRRELQQAANEYVHGKLTPKQFEERVSKYSQIFRTVPREINARGSFRHGLKRVLGW
ncbi:MAG TPA: hypothetical protein VIL85_23350 [Thermomicrobiales bacterium]|jgi:hypothetical protein